MIGEYFVDSGDVDILAHVLGQLVVLLFLEVGVSQVGGCNSVAA
jgi:hypothetical protein